MDGIDFGNMSKKKRALYECMWGSKTFDFPIEKTKRNGSISNNSYTFTSASTIEEDVFRNRLAELFGIKNFDVFKEKFTQSCSGSGQELKRIATVHSSSLCTLLFFYNVTEKNPYIMDIEGEKYIFTYSHFEYQNVVIKGRNPSNIDVILIGKHKKSGKPVVLFLESKFSEYYERPGRQLKIATAYLNNTYGKEIYNEECFAKMGFHMVKSIRNAEFILYSKEICYIEGIKQMISHYIGIRNLCDKSDAKDDRITNAVSAGAKVLLGEILFTKEIGQLPVGNGEECFASYKKRYSILADILNNQLKRDGMNDKIAVLNKILSYSQFRDKDYIQESQIKRFYFDFGKEV